MQLLNKIIFNLHPATIFLKTIIVDTSIMLIMLIFTTVFEFLMGIIEDNPWEY